MESEEQFLECGKVFLTLKGNITFLCTLCEAKYKGYQKYAEHINMRHYAVEFSEEVDSLSDSEQNFFQSLPENKEEESEPDCLPLEGDEINKCEIEESLKTMETIYLPVAEKKITQHKCVDCEYSSDKKYKLMEHMRLHYKVKPYKCADCYRSFHSSNELKRDARIHAHTKRVRCKSNNANATKSILDTENTTEISDENCIEDKQKSIQRSPEKAIIITKTEDDKYKCGKCGYISKDRSNIWGHIKRHSLIKPHQCQFCSKAFYTSTELNSHTRTHTGEKPYLCTECGRAFITSSKLNIHVKYHSNVRDKACPICDMKFFNSTLLRNHLAVHSDERPHTCEICNACFKRRKALKTHLKLHENKREYECQLCGAAFNQKPGLSSHMKSKHSIIKNTCTELIVLGNSSMI